jgi:DNA polymerase III, gamma/tau subunits
VRRGNRRQRKGVLSAIGIAENDEICALLKAVLQGDADAAIAKLDRLYQGGKDVASVLSQLAALHRDILLTRIAPKNGGGLMSGSFPDASLRELGGKADTGRLLSGLNELQEAAARLVRSSDRKLAAELCLLKLSGLRAEFIKSTADTRPAPLSETIRPDPPKQKIDIKAETETELELREEPVKLPDTKLALPVGADEPYKGPAWKEILGKLKGRLSESDYNIIADPGHTSAELTKGLIKIIAASEFSLGFLNSPQILSAVKEAAAEQAGDGTIPVKVKIELRTA